MPAVRQIPAFDWATAPLLAEGLDLAAEPAQFLPLLRGQAVGTPTFIPVGLLEPVPDRLGGRLKLPPEPGSTPTTKGGHTATSNRIQVLGRLLQVFGWLRT